MKILSFIKPYQAPSARFIEMEQPMCNSISVSDDGLDNYNGEGLGDDNFGDY